MKKIVFIIFLLMLFFGITELVCASEYSYVDAISIIDVEAPDLDIGGGNMTCEELVGANLVKVIKFLINLIRIASVIVAIVTGMLTFIPAVTSGDAGALNKAIRKCIWIAVALIIIAMFPVILKVIGNLFGFDLTCIF